MDPSFFCLLGTGQNRSDQGGTQRRPEWTMSPSILLILFPWQLRAGQAEEHCHSESTQRKGEKKERGKSIALDWKALLVLAGRGRWGGESKASHTEAAFPLKARIPEVLSAG